MGLAQSVSLFPFPFFIGVIEEICVKLFKHVTRGGPEIGTSTCSRYIVQEAARSCLSNQVDEYMLMSAPSGVVPVSFDDSCCSPSSWCE